VTKAGSKYLLIGLLCLLFSAPFMFGTVEPWSLGIMETASFSLFFFWFLGIMKSGEKKSLVIKPPFLIPLGLLVCIAIFQCIPLPPFLLTIIAPQTYKVYQDIAIHGEGVGWRTISLYPHATILEIARFVCYIAIYILTFQIVKGRNSIEFLAVGILIAGSCVALSGIFQVGSTHKKLLWFRETSEFAQVFGPYVNRNHFADLMVLLIPVGFGMSVYLLPAIRNKYGRMAMISEFFTHPQTNRLILCFTGVMIMVIGLFLSLSRGAIMAFSVSMMLFGTVLILNTPAQKKSWFLIISLIIVLLTVSWFGWNPIIERFEDASLHTDTSSRYRVHNWKDSLEIINSYPLFGTGLGTYEHVYPRYKTLIGKERWEHAHNDYLEGAIELGIPGLIIGIYILGGFYVMMFRVIRQRRSSLSRLLGIGGMAGVTGMLIHSLVDFNFHIGANALFFSFLFGYSLVVSHANTEQGGSGTLLGQREILVPLKSRRSVIAILAMFWMIVIAISILPAVAEVCYVAAGGPLKNEPSQLIEKRMFLEKGAHFGPLDARFPFAGGSIDAFLRRDGEAIRNYTRAVTLNPVNGEYLRMLGLAYAASGETTHAGQYLKLAVWYDPTSPLTHKNYASWLLSQGKKEEGMAEMRKAISLDPSHIRNYIAVMVLGGLTPSEARWGIPETSLAVSQYGIYRQQIGDTEDALQSFQDALLLMKKEGNVTSELYYRIAEIYEKRGQKEKAMASYEEGVREIPSDVNLRVSLAKSYENLKLFQKAKEEYGVILQLAPSNEHAQKKLTELGAR